MGTELPYWLQNTIICGREGEGQDDSGDEGDEGESDDSEDNGEEGDGETGGTEEGTEDGSNSAEAKALRKALADERRLRRKAERENKQLKRGKDKVTDEEKQSLEETQAKLIESEAKTSRLASGFLNQAINNAILSEARLQKFIDPSDALTDEVRALVREEADQDEDDPSDVDIDADTVKKAVKKLAEKKKHLVAKPNEGERSGGKFGSRRGADDGKPTEDFYKETYPSLNS